MYVHQREHGQIAHACHPKERTCAPARWRRMSVPLRTLLHGARGAQAAWPAETTTATSPRPACIRMRLTCIRTDPHASQYRGQWLARVPCITPRIFEHSLRVICSFLPMLIFSFLVPLVLILLLPRTAESIWREAAPILVVSAEPEADDAEEEERIACSGAEALAACCCCLPPLSSLSAPPDEDDEDHAALPNACACACPPTRLPAPAEPPADAPLALPAAVAAAASSVASRAAACSSARISAAQRRTHTQAHACSE
jgi:hypothetical protein